MIKLLIPAGQFGAYRYDAAGMRWLSLAELGELAESLGFGTFHCLLNHVDPNCQGFVGHLSGRGKRLRISPTP